MHRTRRRLAAIVAVAAALSVIVSCTTGGTGDGTTPTQAADSAGRTGVVSYASPTLAPPTHIGPALLPRIPASRPARTTFPIDPTPVDDHKSALPRGGHTIIGSYRLVAYYGGPDGPALGALGSATPERIAKVIEARAAQYKVFGVPVQPAMELIASVAQASPGPDGHYSATIPAAKVHQYLDVAHRHKMLLILDFQPGRGEFLPQVKRFARFLADPSVSVALDPEWRMHGTQVPGRVIGSASAASINAVQQYVSGIVTSRKLPDKLLMVHQFTLAMLPDRDKIKHYPGLELTFHADGFGSQHQKIATYNALRFPGHPDGSGFKLFLKQDSGGLMAPADVMALRPQPDVITYQ